MTSRFLLVLVLLFSYGQNQAQIKNPSKWSFELVPQNYKVGDIVSLEMNVSIEDGYYIYSNDFDPNLGPTLTTATFAKSNTFELQGKLKAINAKKKFDPVWEGDITYFKNKGKFVQKIKILSSKGKISGTVDFQTCTDESCVPGTADFNVPFSAESGETLKSDTNNSTDSIRADSDKSEANVPFKIEPKSNASELSKTAGESPKSSSLFNFLIIAFLAGLASIFMPCIYPIMPMTVSFFTKQENGRLKAIFYGICIMFIFACMGLITKQLGAPFLNFLSTHWVPNLIFFILFIVFGFSLLGAFEIVMPHETVNKIDRLSEKGGFIGIFFMALTLVLVSFSCTVPFVGSLLIAAAQGEVMRPIYGMLAFGLPFALVFGGLAMFPSFLKSLPKSGGWLNELKAVFGFLEFALALKFLSNIDLTYHWNLLHRNIFLGLWIVAAVIIMLYILGFMRLKKDSPVNKISWSRAGFAALFFAASIYMIPGLANKPLSLLSGILPPLITGNSGSAPAANMRELPLGLYGFHEIEDAQAYAQKVNKPVLIDFTGYACANCRKMEENVWPEPKILSKLKNNFVIASLYVDDKQTLPKEKQYVSKYNNKLISTVGQKNMDYEIVNYNNNAQPYYVIISPSGEKIAGPLAYSSKEQFDAFLDLAINP
jgi:thiol:disulfide interchange protein